MGLRSPDPVLEMLRRHESRNITFMEPEAGWPIIWQRACISGVGWSGIERPLRSCKNGLTKV